MVDKAVSMALDDLKLRAAEHIWIQNNQRKTSLQEILAENKIGVQQRSELVKVLKGIFSLN